MGFLTKDEGLTLLSPWQEDQREFFLKTYTKDMSFRKFMNDKVEQYIEDPLVVVSSDASQAEVRIAAELSGEKKLLDLYEKQRDLEDRGIDTSSMKDLDVHCLTAAGMFGISPFDVKAEQRKPAKNITFGVLYGATKYRVSFETGLSIKEADKLIKKFWKAYPKIKPWVNTIIAEAVVNGYVSTPTGRRESVPTLKNKKDVLRAFVNDEEMYKTLKKIYTYETIKQVSKEIRKARNFPIQSYTSDLVFHGAYLLRLACRKEGIEFFPHTLVHDAVVASVRLSQLKRYLSLVKETCETRVMKDFDLRCPFRVEAEVGLNYHSEVKLPPLALIDTIDTDKLVDDMYSKWKNLVCKTVFTNLGSDATIMLGADYQKASTLLPKEQELAEIDQETFEALFLQYREDWNINMNDLDQFKQELSPVSIEKISKEEERFIS